MAADNVTEQYSALYRALTSPTRRRIMLALLTPEAKQASPTELAAELGEPLKRIAYHVRVMANDRVLRMVGEDGSKGGLRHIYAVPELAQQARPLLEAEAREKAA